MDGRGIDRRALLTGLSAAAWWRWGHPVEGTAGPLGGGSSESRETNGSASAPGAHRLRRLELATAAPLAAMKAFYSGRLGLEILEDTGERLTIAGGATPVTFRQAGPDHPAPFYHFAFNIPENKILAAREWQLDRTPIEPPPANLRDPAMPPEIVHFRSWDAHSIFFWDPAGNFVEYIARHTLDSAAEGDFSSRDILYASEIAFVTDDTAALAAQLQPAFDLPGYGSASAAFRALGDERGLLLLFRRGRQMGWVNGGKPIDVAPVTARIRTKRTGGLQVLDYPYRVEPG